MPRKTLGATPPPLPARPTVAPTVARNRVLLALLLPLAAAVVVGAITGALFLRGDLINTSAIPFFATLGVASWFVGLRLYGLRGMGLRGGRPLFAGIGFSTLAWIAALIGRWLPGAPRTSFNPDGAAVVTIPLLVEVIAYRADGSGRAFFYLLLFEAFAVQLWAFGLVFRALADYRGGLTAAIISGLLFGAVGLALFGESFVVGVPGVSWVAMLPSLSYFLLWGVLYGIIRLRTGSILGPVLMQALQSFTVWFVLQPPADMTKTGIQTVLSFISLLFVIIIWRLWPRLETDYRI